MIKFDLEKAMKNGGKCRVTCPGYASVEGQIVYTKMPGTYSILVVVVDDHMIYRFSPEGVEFNTSGKLENLQETFDVWVILYRNGHGTLGSYTFLDNAEYDNFLNTFKMYGFSLVSSLNMQMTEGGYKGLRDPVNYISSVTGPDPL